MATDIVNIPLNYSSFSLCIYICMLQYTQNQCYKYLVKEGAALDVLKRYEKHTTLSISSSFLQILQMEEHEKIFI